METPLRLNVGGQTFLVSLATLKRYPSCILANPDLVSLAESSQPPFIDRDPDLFVYILNFLRCEHPAYYEGPTDRPTRRRLAYESRFYKLVELEEALKPKTPKPAEKPDFVAIPSKYLYVICEKYVVFNDAMKPVSGHFVIEGKAEAQRSWLGFSEEKLTQRFSEQVAARLQGYRNKGYEIKNTQTSTTTQIVREASGDGVLSGGRRQWCHITSSAFLLQQLP